MADIVALTTTGSSNGMRRASSSADTLLVSSYKAASGSDLVFYTGSTGGANVFRFKDAGGTDRVTIDDVGKLSCVDLEVTGTLTSLSTTNTEVEDKLVTFNKGGGAGTEDGAGIEIEANSTIAASLKWDSTLGGWVSYSTGTTQAKWQGKNLVLTGTTADIRIAERTGDPTNVANTGFYYTKDVSGNTESFYLDSTGNAVQITSGGAVNAPGGTTTLDGAYNNGGRTITVDSGEVIWTNASATAVQRLNDDMRFEFGTTPTTARSFLRYTSSTRLIEWQADATSPNNTAGIGYKMTLGDGGPSSGAPGGVGGGFSETGGDSGGSGGGWTATAGGGFERTGGVGGANDSGNPGGVGGGFDYTGGVGGANSSTNAGGVGGGFDLTGGVGGASTSGVGGIGGGFKQYCGAGGSGGTTGGVGGSWYCDSGAPGTGGSPAGSVVYIGQRHTGTSYTSAITVGNTDQNPTVSFVGTGAWSCNPNASFSGTVSLTDDKKLNLGAGTDVTWEYLGTGDNSIITIENTSAGHSPNARSFTSNGLVTAGDVLKIIDSTGTKVDQAQGDSEANALVSCVALETGTDAAVRVAFSGSLVKVKTSATINAADVGKVAWLDPDTEGAVTVTKPTTGGDVAIRVGHFIKSGVSLTAMIAIDIGYPETI